MKGIETFQILAKPFRVGRSDHCPAMKGIETVGVVLHEIAEALRSDHCPAMKGIETCGLTRFGS